MPLFSPSFLFTSVSATAAWFYLNRTHNGSPRLHPVLSAFILVHSLFILHAIVNPPANLFNRLSIPLTTPVEHIRYLIIREAGMPIDAANIANTTLPRDIEHLLHKLSQFDSRMLYTRFGQRALQTCQHCVSASDYALFNLPGPLLAYIRTVAVVALLTSRQTSRERWRPYLLLLLFCAVLAEAYMVLMGSATVSIPRDGKGATMWYDMLYIFRQALFLVLPILINFLPPSSASDKPLTLLPPALSSLEQAMTRVHLLKYVRGAVMRHPRLKERASQWWARQAKDGSLGRNDKIVQHTAEKFGLGYGPYGPEERHEGGTAEGKLKTSARMAVEALKNGFNGARPS